MVFLELYFFLCRASSRKSFIKHPMNILERQLQYDRHGLIHKCLAFHEPFAHLDVNASRKIVIKW